MAHNEEHVRCCLIGPCCPPPARAQLLAKMVDEITAPMAGVADEARIPATGATVAAWLYSRFDFAPAGAGDVVLAMLENDGDHADDLARLRELYAPILRARNAKG